MTPETAERVLDWLSRGGEKMVGLMGGEPTIHPRFETFLDLAARKGIRCSVFTNGLKLEETADALKRAGARVLVNLNEPSALGAGNVRALERGLEAMLEKGLRDRLTFGVNICRRGYDFSYAVEWMKRFGHHELRTAIAVPNSPASGFDTLDYLRGYMADVIRLAEELDSIGAFPSFDCNRLPMCLVRESGILQHPALEEMLRRSNLAKGAEPCQPVMDILPDETAIRCFGLSEKTRVRISDFRSPRHLRRYWETHLDALGFLVPPEKKCTQCYEYLAGLCQGGCLVYRMPAIERVQALIKEVNTQ